MVKIPKFAQAVNPGVVVALARRAAIKNAGKWGSIGSSLEMVGDVNFWGTIGASWLLDRYTRGLGTTAAGLAALPDYINDPDLYDEVVPIV